LRLLGRASSLNVRKVLWTCDEIGLDYVREDWGAGFTPTTEPAFLALNPNAQVPVIEDDNGVLWESNTICRYLAARHGRPDLLPVDPWARAGVEQWMDWGATDLNAAWTYPFMALVRKHPAYADPAQIAAGAEAWNAKLAILDRRLAETGAHVAGQTFTLADVVLGLAVHRWVMTPIDHADLPSVAAYYERLTERPAFRAHGRNPFP
jgi:glutathione S-transferase